MAAWTAAPYSHAQDGGNKASAHAAPAASSYEQARELFWQASEEYRKANYAPARDLFAKAHALEPGAATFRALGFCDYQLEQYVPAMVELHAALAEPRSNKVLAPDQKQEVAQLIAKIKPLVSHLTLVTEPAESSVQLDGKPVEQRELWLLPGEHTLTASAAGHRDQTVKLTLAGGAEQHTSLALALIARDDLQPTAAASGAAAPGSSPRVGASARDADPAAAGRVRGIVGLGVGGALLVTGIVTGALSIVKTHDEEHHCSGSHCPLESRSALSTANTLANVCNVTLALGAVSIGYGLYELLTLPSAQAEHARSSRIRIAFTGTGLALHGQL